MSDACAVEIASMLLAMEAGQLGSATLFHNFQCGDPKNGNNNPPDKAGRPVSTAFRWPAAGDFIGLNDYNKRIPVKQFCDTQNGANSTPGSCPLPTIKSAIIPPFITVIFRAKDPKLNNGQPLVADPGQVNLTATSPGVNQNIWNLDTSSIQSTTLNAVYDNSEQNKTSGRLIWRSQLRNGSDENNPSTGQLAEIAFCGAGPMGYTANSQPCNQWVPVCAGKASPYGFRSSDSKQGQMLTQTMMSCGQPFFPTLMGLANVLTNVTVHVFPGESPQDNLTPALQLYNGRWSTCSDYDSRSTQYCLAGQNPNFSFRSVLDYSTVTGTWRNVFLNNSTPLTSFLDQYGDMTYNTIKYSACDCIATVDAANSADKRFCVPATYIGPFGGFTPTGYIGFSCNIKSDTDAVQRIEGNIDSIEFRSDWDTQVIKYCVGTEELTIGGTKVKRYGQATEACDEIMFNYCLSSVSGSNLLDDPNAANYCQCIWAKQALDSKLANLDLPVNCFEQACNVATPFVYRTRENQNACTGSLCQQIIKLFGQDLVVSGIQNMICNGTALSVASDIPATANNNANNNNSSSLTNSSSSGLSLTPLFFGALAILCVAFLLAGLWLWRRHIVNSRKKTIQQQQSVSLIKSYLHGS